MSETSSILRVTRAVDNHGGDDNFQDALARAGDAAAAELRQSEARVASEVARQDKSPAGRNRRVTEMQRRSIEQDQEALVRVSAATKIECDDLDNQAEDLRRMMEAEISKVRAAADREISELRASMNTQLDQIAEKKAAIMDAAETDIRELNRSIASSQAYIEAMAKDAVDG